MDSHKLIFHPERVAAWLGGQEISPITIEISPSGACNHRCRFCAFDYLNYQTAFLEKELIFNNLTQMAEQGVKAVVVAGEGEPLLNKNTPEIIRKVKELGMDVSMSTNGVLFSEEIADKCLPALSWVRFSLNAGTDHTYNLIHRGRPDDFQTVIGNLKKAAEIKHRDRLPVTLGVQMLLLPENVGEALTLGKILKETGVDYFTVKPYSQHPMSINNMGANMDYRNYLILEDELNELSGGGFTIYFRARSMQKLQQERSYSRCWGLPFWAYLDARANLWACIAYVGDPQFCYGNLQEATFQEIWEGKKRAALKEYIQRMDVGKCRELCRLDAVNTYLHQLKNPHPHVNFI